jgi:hypothetical protein
MRDMPKHHLGNERNDRIQIPVNAEEKRKFFKLAEKARLTLSAFGRQLFYKALDENQAGKKSEAA